MRLLRVKSMTWTYQKAASIPLFICIDQEGGKVNRLKEKYGFTKSVTAALWVNQNRSTRFVFMQMHMQPRWLASGLM
jgi:hypothetical protein